jgi:alpha-ketoglutarate-dependent taurine dioxygenase
MKVKFLENCGVELLDIDVLNLNEEEYSQIKDLLFEHLVVVIKNQPQLSVPFAKLVYSIAPIDNWKNCRWKQDGTWIGQQQLINPFDYVGDDNSFPVQRVTGQKVQGSNMHGGIFGSGILDWHTNMNGPGASARGVGLQAISEGTRGTSTSWLDTTKAYDTLSEKLKLRCNEAFGEFEFSPEIWAEGLPEFQLVGMKEDGYKGTYQMPLVHASKKGDKSGLYFHYLNKCSIPNDLELLDLLKVHCLNNDFVYTHIWSPGDIVLSDQLLTLHRRDQNDPAILGQRVLSRYGFDY